jgi:acyl carrier protein
MTAEQTAQVEDVLSKIVSRILRKDKVVLDRNMTFKDLGADSLDIVQVMVAIEESFNIELNDEELKAITNIGGFIDYIKDRISKKQ